MYYIISYINLNTSYLSNSLKVRNKSNRKGFVWVSQDSFTMISSSSVSIERSSILHSKQLFFLEPTFAQTTSDLFTDLS